MKTTFDQHDIDRFLERVEKAAYAITEKRYEADTEPLPGEGRRYIYRPILSCLTCNNPGAEWILKLLNLNSRKVATALLMNEDDAEALHAIEAMM